MKTVKYVWDEWNKKMVREIDLCTPDEDELVTPFDLDEEEVAEVEEVVEWTENDDLEEILEWQPLKR